MFAVIVNQEAKDYTKECLNRVLSYLEIHNKSFELFIPDPSEKPFEVYKRALCSNNSILILLGGDGSLRFLIQTAMDLDIKKPIGIIPVGRENKSSRCLDISQDVEEACEIICLGFHYKINIGVLELGNGSVHYFHHSANVGLQANINQPIPSISGKVSNKGLNTLSSLRRTLFDRPVKFDVHYSTNTLVGTSLIVGNGTLFDEPSDPLIKRLLSSKLQSCLLTNDQKVAIAEFLIRNKIGNHNKMKQIQQFKSEEIQIHKPDIPIILDGDYIGNTPAKFSQLIGAYPMVSKNYKFEAKANK